MKKPIVTLSLITLFIANTCAQITNGGFEDWTNSFVFADPDEWRTGNGQLAPFVQTTQVTAGAPNGNSAVHLETLINGDDTLFGFVMVGNIEDDVATEGVPFTTDISEINAQLRYDIQPGDSALVLLNVWQGSVATEFQVRIGGSQATWMNWTYSLGTTMQSVDSVAFAAASSDPFNPVAVSGSWLELDNVLLTDPSITIVDLLPNNSFEDWSDVYVEDPDNWFTYNLPAQSLGVTPVVKSTDAFAGNFSAQLSNIMGDGGTIPGFITNGTVGSEGFSNGVPYAAQPTLFTGHYKYSPVDMDTAYVSVTFFQNGNVIGANAMAIFDPATAWTAISLPLNLTGVPDTMQFIAFTGQNAGSTLWLDELDLSGGTVGLDELEQSTWHVYPSPAQDQLYIANNTNAPLERIRLLSTNGTLVHVGSNTPTFGTTALDVSRLSAGIYIVEVTQAGTIIRKRFVKE
ncbi:MAG: T9SS type A sorting domain-containing protein [Flavobacteriales bacterium]